MIVANLVCVLQSEKKSRNAKKTAKKQAEAEIRSKEERLLRDAAPESDGTSRIQSYTYSRCYYLHS